MRPGKKTALSIAMLLVAGLGSDFAQARPGWQGSPRHVHRPHFVSRVVFVAAPIYAVPRYYYPPPVYYTPAPPPG